MSEIVQCLSLLLTGLMSVLVGIIYKKISTARAWVMGTAFFVVGYFVDGLFALLIQGFVGESEMLQLLGILIAKSIMLSYLLGLKIFAQEQAGRGGGTTMTAWEKQDVSFVEAVCWQYYEGLTLAVSCFFLLLGIGTRWQNIKVTTKIWVLLSLLFVLVAYYFSVSIHLHRQKAKATRTEAESKKYEAEMYLESVENNYQRTRELWHDLKNHINLMNLLLQEEKYGELKDYLRIFGEDVDSLTLPVKSGNVIVDALLADKLNKARHEKVEVSLSLCNLTGLKLKSDEICGLLGNLLDNALEANLRLREGRTLEVTCKEQEECYYIRVRNPVSGSGGGDEVVAKQDASQGSLCNKEAAPEAQKEFPKTAKSDRRNQVGHGLGLRSVERIVHGCGGELAVENGEKYFTVVVRLPS